MNRADADDFSGGRGDFCNDSPAKELLDRFSGTEKLAGQVNADHPVPLLQGHVDEGRILLDTGVVDEDVRGSELPLRAFKHGNDFFFLGHVSLVGNGSGAASLNLLYHRLRGFFAGVKIHEDVGACGAEGDRNAAADAGVRARHNCLLRS